MLSCTVQQFLIYFILREQGKINVGTDDFSCVYEIDIVKINLDYIIILFSNASNFIIIIIA